MRRAGSAQMDAGSARRFNLPTFTKPNLILVEGADEFHFLNFLRLGDDVQIHIYEGKDQLRLELQTIAGVEGFGQVRQVAILRDADNDPPGSLQSVLSQWSVALNEPLPRVVSDEWFRDTGGRRWSAWIMPAANRTGDLEELLWQTIPENGHRGCIEALMTCLDGCEPIPFRSRTKARLYAWLSTQPNH